MKCLPLIAFAAMSIIAQSIPDWANAATVTLVPFEPANVGLVSLSDKCNTPARVDEAYADAPAIASLQGVTGIAEVKIALTASGALSGETLFASSGNPWLDRAAMESAGTARFTPAVANCRRVGGMYLYEVDF